MNPFPLHVLICVVYFITVVFCRKGISKMKSIFIVRVMSLMAVGLSLFMGAANAAVDSNKEVIGIMDLKAEGDLKSASGILSDRLRAELFNTGRFAVMERGEMDAILKEQGFQQSGVCDDKACMVEIGQLLGASKMVAGSIGMLGTVYLINLRIIDVSTGKLVDTYSGECRCRIEDLGGAMKTAADRLAGGAKTAPQAIAQSAAPVAAPQPAPQAVQETAVETASDKPVRAMHHWTLGLFWTAHGADPEFNNVMSTYENPPIFHNYQLVQESGEVNLTTFKGGGLYLCRKLTSHIALRISGLSTASSGIGGYRLQPAPHNTHLFSGGNITIETDVRNSLFAVGGRASWHFNRLHPYAGIDLLMFSSSYSFSAAGQFDGYDTLGIRHQGKIDAHVDLDHSGPGFGVNVGAVLQLTRRFGIELQVAFTRLELSGYEGTGNLAKLDNVLAGDVVSDGETNYTLSMGQNNSGGEVYFFEKTSPSFLSQPIADRVLNKEQSSVDFSGPSASLGLNIFF